MFYAIKEKKIDLKSYEFEISSDEIGNLNQEVVAGNSSYDIVALSFHALSLVDKDYSYLKSGASLAGKDYGPRLVSKNLTELRNGLKIAIPGKHTTAFKVLQIWLKETEIDDIEFKYCSYNEVFDLLDTGAVDASLLIHESQLRYKELGYKLIIDFGSWWYQKHSGLRLPLGCNAIKKELGTNTIQELDSILKESIEWSLKQENLEEAINYSKNFAQNQLDDAMAKKYIEMYVDQSTVQLSRADEESISKLRCLSK